MTLLVFSEAPTDFDATDDADIAGLTVGLRDCGAQVVPIDREYVHEHAAALLDGLPPCPQASWGVLVGHIPSEERYRALYSEARARNVSLLNAPAQHLDALELSRGVDRLGTLTARTEVVARAEEVGGAVARLGLPVFVKGDIFSRKWHGWDACVAETAERAEAIAAALLKVTQLARERVLLRQLLPLLRHGESYEGFPTAREYRLFCLDGKVVGQGYYWPFEDPFGALAVDDQAALAGLAREAFARLSVPWLALDVGQLEDRSWRIIETGDPQCSGLGHIAPRPLARALVDAVARRQGPVP
jgi:hypothetical protein